MNHVPCLASFGVDAIRVDAQWRGNALSATLQRRQHVEPELQVTCRSQVPRLIAKAKCRFDALDRATSYCPAFYFRDPSHNGMLRQVAPEDNSGKVQLWHAVLQALIFRTRSRSLR